MHAPTKNGLCVRCLRTMPIRELDNRKCTDRHACSKALLQLIRYRKGRVNG